MAIITTPPLCLVQRNTMFKDKTFDKQPTMSQLVTCMLELQYNGVVYFFLCAVDKSGIAVKLPHFAIQWEKLNPLVGRFWPAMYV